jgi:LCP family protein required for cell wall assembly
VDFFRASLRAFPKRVAIACLLAGALTLTGVVGVNALFNQKLGQINRVKVTTAPPPPKGANFLLIGSDSRKFVQGDVAKNAFGDQGTAGGQRSDTMMVVHVEPGAQRSLIVSFPRDLWVNVPGVGMSKINAAFNYGPDKVIQTLKANFDIDINHYLEVDFKSFEGIVNAIGRVPVYFPQSARDLKSDLTIAFPGCAALDGAEALSYVRSRALEYYDVQQKKWVLADSIPDIGRIGRQQAFIRRLLSLAVQRSLNNPLTANEVADNVVKNLTADEGLSRSDVNQLIRAFRTVDANDPGSVEMVTLPWKDGPRQAGQQVLYPKEPDAEQMLARLRTFQAAAPATPQLLPASVRLRVLNGSGKVGSAASALAVLQKQGFSPAGSGNDPRGHVAVTEVRYRPDAEAKAKLVLGYVSPNAKLVQDDTIADADVVVVLGANFQSIVTPAAATPAPATAAPATPPTQAAAPGNPAPPDTSGQPAAANC